MSADYSSGPPRRRGRADRSAVFPSPVVMLSIIAVFMAGVAFVATRNPEPTEREVTPVVQPETSPTPQDRATRKPTAKPTKKKPKSKPVQRGSIYVEVYNNSNISGLAGRVAESTSAAGWQVVGSDNWVGTIPSSTVYYPTRLKKAGRLLALDLGIERTKVAVDPMRRDRLTVILTGELG